MFNSVVRGRRTSPLRLCRVVFAGAVLPAAALVQAAAPTIPLTDFVQRGQFRAPSLSPDGKHLVVTQRVQKDGRDESVMVVYDLAELKIRSTVRMPVFETPAGYRWITNSRLAVSTGREYGSLEGPQLNGEVVAMDIDGRKQEYLYGYNMYGRSRRGTFMADDKGYGSIAHVPDALDGHFLLTENLWSTTATTSRLYDIDSTNAARKLVTEISKPGFDFMMQADGKPRFAFGNDADASYTVFKYDDTKSAWQEFSNAERGDLWPTFISLDNKTLLSKSSVNRGPRALVRQPIAGGERVVLAEDKVGNIDVVEWGPKNTGPFAAGTEVGVPKLRYFDEQRPEAQLHKLLSAQFPKSHVHFINFSEDGAKLLFSVASDRDPGAYYLFDRNTGKAVFLFATMPWIEPERMAEQRPIRYKARDGLEIHGYLTLPVNRDDAKLPLVLLPHGGPHGPRDEWFFDKDAQFLASRGYAVMQVNYRGSGGRGPGFESAGYRQWGGKIQEDLIDGVRWIIAQGTVDEKRVCAYGASFGAYSAMMSAIRAPELFKCAVGYAGVYDLAMMYDNPRVKERRTSFNYFVKVIGEDAAELAANSPARMADKLGVPVLLVHGGGDEIALPAQAETMRDALKKAGRPPEWFYVADEGHGFYAEKNRQAFYEKLEAFLAKHIGK